MLPKQLNGQRVNKHTHTAHQQHNCILHNTHKWPIFSLFLVKYWLRALSLDWELHSSVYTESRKSIS